MKEIRREKGIIPTWLSAGGGPAPDAEALDRPQAAPVVAGGASAAVGAGAVRAGRGGATGAAALDRGAAQGTGDAGPGARGERGGEVLGTRWVCGGRLYQSLCSHRSLRSLCF